MRGIWGPIRISVAIAALGFTGCATSSAKDNELSRLRRELHFVRQDLTKQKKKVDALERRVTLLSLGKSPPPMSSSPNPPPPPLASRSVTINSAPPPPPPPTRPRALPRGKVLPIVRLGKNARPKPPAPEDEYDPGALDDGGPPIMITMGADDDEEDRLPVDRNVLKRPDPVLEADGPSPTRADVDARPRRSSASKKQVREEYRAALALLREQRQPRSALASFDAFLAKHPKSKLADNAEYWRGECFFALKKHAQAVAAFERLLERHPRSAKVPFALLRKGESLMVLGRKPQARIALKQVTDLYADSEAAQSAQRLLLKLTSGQ